MNKSVLFILLLMLILTGCNSKTIKEDLIGGTWVATSGYEDAKAQGDANCYPFQEGMEFNDEQNVYIKARDRSFEYELNDKGTEITFRDSGPNPSSEKENSNSITTYHRYKIKKISADEIALNGQSLAEGNSCVLERN